MSSILRPGRNCERIDSLERAGVLIDARDYYLAVHAALTEAQHTVLIAGWQFDSGVPLLRGPDANGTDAPVELLPLLEHLVKARPELRIHLLAWDYSIMLAAEREWLQRLKFDWMTDSRIRFVFDSQHPAAASHHQKLVAVDGAIAFVGGIDLCDARWDDMTHALDNPLRFRLNGELQKPYHDLMAWCSGPVVQTLEQLFCTRWRRATGEVLELPAARDARPALSRTAMDLSAPIECPNVAVSLTFGAHAASDTAQVEQIKTLYEDAIAQARQLIYLETQYFTSRAIHAALIDRMRSRRSRLEIVMMLPAGADTPKENFVLGDAQRWALSTLCRVALECGHQLRVLCSMATRQDGSQVPTFIHSKALFVDDRLLTIGSANCTNRSMGFDSELNLAWECRGHAPLSASIAKLRARLLCEHAGIAYDPSLEARAGLVARIDELIGRTKLCPRDLPQSPDEVDASPLLEQMFDPEHALGELGLEEWLEPRRA